MKFDQLINEIEHTYLSLQQQAVKAINKTLTLRNWLIGFYIVEFEQNGEEMAKYGESLLENLAAKLDQASLSFRNLKLFRQFYQVYPQIGQTLSAQFSLTKSMIRQAPSDVSYFVAPEKLLDNLSFSHFVELLVIKDPMKRTFYEPECMKSNWGVRESKGKVSYKSAMYNFSYVGSEHREQE